MTDLTDKQETLVRTVGITGMAAHRAGLARVVGVYLDRHASSPCRFVGNHAVQFGECPFGAGGIGLPLLLAGAFALAPLPGTFADVGQVFQSDQAVGMEENDALRDDMIGVGFQPSLPLADDDQSPRCGTGAFLLQTLSQSRVMVGGCNHALAGVETGVPPRVAGDRQVANTYIYPDDARMCLGRRVGHLQLKGDQQVELLAGLVIPEFGRTDGRAVLDEGRMLAIACIGDDRPARKRQDTHPAITLEAVVMPQLVLKRRGDVARSLIQSLVAFLGQTRLTHGSILLDFGPQALVGGSYLPGDRAGHLRWNLEAGAYLTVRPVLQVHLVAHLAMFVGILAHIVQRITIGQLGLPQCFELLRQFVPKQ